MKLRVLRLSGRRRYMLMTILLFVNTMCTFNIAIKVDRRVQIENPPDRSTVRLPLELRWRVKNFRIVPPNGRGVPDSGYFAIFVDRAPMPPGRNLSWISRDDACTPAGRCVNESYLNGRGVYTTWKTRLLLQTLADTRPTGRPQVRDRHEITIVLIDGSGKRIGESAFFTRFTVQREAEQE